jgi:DNA-binding MarR family transcriptional regulator
MLQLVMLHAKLPSVKLPLRPRDEIHAFHEQSFGYALAQLSRLFHDSLASTLDGTGLHLGHVLLLATLRAQRELHGESTLTQTRLAEATGIEKSSLVLFLDALEHGGWVERCRHPRDRRAHIVHLTDEGARRFEQVGLGLYRQQQANLAPLDEAEQAAMLEMMNRLTKHLSPGG